jgi:trk system potassium uptake protein TrkA
VKDKQFAVIGMGRFGSSLTRELTRMGYEVLAIDEDEEKVSNAAEYATHAVQADSMDINTLKALGIRNFDVVVVAIGENVQANILTTILLKEMGVKKVLAKAQNELHGKVLEKIGTELVVYPERDMAIKIARSLTSTSLLEQISLSPDYAIAEFIAQPEFVNKTLVESGIRKRYKVNILAIRRGDEIIVAPPPESRIMEGDILVALGRNEDLERFSQIGE